MANDETIVHPEMTFADWQFCCLARQAFDVMMRRRWTSVPMLRGLGEHWWGVRLENGADPELKYIVESPTRGMFKDPFTALVEADEWYKANGENPPS
jgi:hypothetical protein